MAVPPTPLPVPDKNMGARMSKDNQLNKRFPNHSPFQMKYSVAVVDQRDMLILSLNNR
jgi:hypothetical protein